MQTCFRCLVLLVLVSVVAGCCGPAPLPAPPPVQIAAQWSGAHSGADAPATLVIRNAGDWAALWARLGREAPRVFDPAREIGVAVFIGERRTGGYSVEWVGLRPTGDTLVIEYRERVPPPDAMLAQVITSPWAVAVLPHTGGRIKFAEIGSSPDNL